jgi:serine dehydrogenase proteinase
MGIYSEYLDRQLNMQQLTAERKRQLRRISENRGGRDILVCAADLTEVKTEARAPISIIYSDLLPISDQLANLRGTSLDLILETPGGSGEIAEDIVRLIRGRYDDVAVIIPGCAKSAGTIMAMAADEILMEPMSALGPIDAQLTWQGKVFSAGALLEGLEKIKAEVQQTGALNRAYIPILQGISPGEIQRAENAQNFAKVLVTDWLTRYKFRNWVRHSSNGNEVTAEERRRRAEEIATLLTDHGRWLTHGRSIKLDDLEKMRLRITDYSQNAVLADAIRRYYTLLQMTFTTNIYKVFETPTSQIYRFLQQNIPPPQRQGEADVAIVENVCVKCNTKNRVQANLGKKAPLQEGCLAFPANNKLPCTGCGVEIDLSEMRRQIEAQSKKLVVT